MKKTIFYFTIALTILFSLSSTAWSFGGGGRKSSGKIERGDAELFGVEMGSSREDLLARCASVGLNAVDVSEKSAIFNDFVEIEVPVHKPDVVGYSFIKNRVGKLVVIHKGTSAPFRTYRNYFITRFGRSESLGVDRHMWTTEKLEIVLYTNQKEEMERQLTEGVFDGSKLKVVLEATYIPLDK